MPESDSALTNVTAIKKPWLKRSKWGMLVLLLAACIGGYYLYHNASQKSLTYLTMPVTKDTIVNQVQATGSIKPLHEVDLYFRQQGTLKALNARSGDSVKAGEVLAVQDDSDLQAQLEQTRSDLEQAQYQHQLSQINYDKAQSMVDRDQALNQQGAIAKSDLEQAERDLATAGINLKENQVAINSSKAKLAIAESNLAKAQLTAPFSGIASAVNGEIGQDTGNSSSPMFHLISNELQLQVMVNEVDIGHVQLNQNVTYKVGSFPGKTFLGTVSRISPQSAAVGNIQYFEVDISTKDLSKQLRAGMSVTAKIIVDKRDQVLAVPNLALSYAQTYLSSNAQKTSQKWGTKDERRSWQSSTQKNGKQGRVVVINAGKPVLKQVTLGLSDGQNTEVISGLKQGEKVIIGVNDPNAKTTTGNSTNQNSSGQRSFGGGMGGVARYHD